MLLQSTATIYVLYALLLSNPNEYYELMGMFILTFITSG